VDSELRFGLGLAVEAKVLADINATSGIQTQSYTTSGLTTLGKGMAKRETAGYAAATPSGLERRGAGAGLQQRR
jgi:hypothetical protein